MQAALPPHSTSAWRCARARSSPGSAVSPGATRCKAPTWNADKRRSARDCSGEAVDLRNRVPVVLGFPPRARHDMLRRSTPAFRGRTARSTHVATKTKQPNILVMWGDDIGQSNLSCYTKGMMGYRTPNIDRIAKEGMIFTDAYAEQSCTAG